MPFTTNSPSAFSFTTQFILNSKQKYQPCFRITSDTNYTAQIYIFPELQFMAVTAYQNDRVHGMSLVISPSFPVISFSFQITQKKIDLNPYSRGFRESKPSKCKSVMRASSSYPLAYLYRIHPKRHLRKSAPVLQVWNQVSYTYHLCIIR